MNQTEVITRFPPSPTGFLHIGNMRTALFNYLFAAHRGGTMIFRFEDTDRERSKKEFEDDIFESLRWLGLKYKTPSILRQSERTDVYKKYFAQLVEKSLVYEAEESEINPGTKVVRFKNPNAVITFTDLIRGEVTVDTTDLGDFVVARSMNEPLYHLAVVIDDFEMEVTHIIRGEDHISNTPRQILLLEALGFHRPIYAHMPLILAPDKTKLSKRHGAVSVNEYRAMGYTPEALLNYMALLGWNPGGDRELFTLEELATEFTIERVHKAGAIFDIEKLKWFNHAHLKRLSDEEYAKRLQEFVKKDIDQRVIPLLKERAATLKEAAEVLESEFNFFGDISYDSTLLLNNGKLDAATTKKHLEKTKELLAALSSNAATPDVAKAALMPYADEAGRGEVLWPLRVALSGKAKSPDPFTLIWLLGNEESLKRIEQALLVL